MTGIPPCAVCGATVQAGERFCSKCGSDLGAEATALLTTPLDLSALPLNEATLPLLLRQATAGEFEIVRELGRGAMAAVFLAKDTQLGRDVAIKVMSPALVSAHGTMERFLREARTVATLTHPHIIPIYLIRRRGDLTFFVMQYLMGKSLDDVLKNGPLPIPQVIRILREVGSALAYAHRQGVIHRDIKPANVMLDGDGNAMVTDFGIAKSREGQVLTQVGAFVGTPAYMSPEQCAADPVTGASDQYCLGIMAYEMIEGRLPFDGTTLMGVLYQHLHTPAPVIQRPDAPPELGRIVHRMLEKKAGDRWPDLGGVVAALDAMGTPSAPVRPEAPLKATFRSARGPAPRSRRLLIGGVVVGVVVIAGAIVRFRRIPSSVAPPPEASIVDTLGPARDRVSALIDSGIANNAAGEYRSADRWLDSAGRMALGITDAPLVALADSARRANASGCLAEAALRGGRGGALRCP